MNGRWGQGRIQDFVKVGAPSMDKTKGLWETVSASSFFYILLGSGGAQPLHPPDPLLGGGTVELKLNRKKKNVFQ